MRALLAFLLLVFGANGLAATRPNIIVILADDLGFSDIGCYGGEIATPNLDQLASEGIRYTQFYNTGRCCPTRASLLTGLYPHQAQVGHMVDGYAKGLREHFDSPAYSDRLNPRAPTIAEALREAGYRTFMTGKWHVGYRTNEWPAARGFDRSFALIEGAMNYYGFGIQNTGEQRDPLMAMDREKFVPPREGFFATDAFTDNAVKFIAEHKGSPAPFFLYLAYTAPHWPLHARVENITRHRGKYREIGWDKLREQRLGRLKQAGIIAADAPLGPRPPRVPEWEKASAEQQEQWDLEMAIYAAQVQEMDAGIGRVLRAVKDGGFAGNTLIVFLSDNGGAAEDPNRSLSGATLGARESYEGYRIHGAHVSSAPFRRTKKFTHEGGIATPLIVHWSGLDAARRGTLNHEPAHIIDLMPTFLELAEAKFPREWKGERTAGQEGVSLAPTFRGRELRRSKPIFWEHEGNRAVRDGKWKIVSTFGEPWELFDLEADRTELRDLAGEQPDRLKRMVGEYEAWAARAGVLPWPQTPPK